MHNRGSAWLIQRIKVSDLAFLLRFNWFSSLSGWVVAFFQVARRERVWRRCVLPIPRLLEIIIPAIKESSVWFELVLSVDMDAMVFEAQLVSDSQGSATANGSGGESRADVNVDANDSIHAAAVPMSTNIENPKVTRESVFNRLSYSNVMGGEKAGNLDFFPWRTRKLVWSRSPLSLQRR
ncbi:hypothetical protein L6452_40660 [Arctium lappa]|uniref:Uncharacterized protein n=1 Tax=Arctium lappa TaxID=4217 RepID=A0ACB8XNN3_ARCLA|nr:hypothetical protein L6452_40660 [Arctium lappa]